MARVARAVEEQAGAIRRVHAGAVLGRIGRNALDVAGAIGAHPPDVDVGCHRRRLAGGWSLAKANGRRQDARARSRSMLAIEGEQDPRTIGRPVRQPVPANTGNQLVLVRAVRVSRPDRDVRRELADTLGRGRHGVGNARAIGRPDRVAKVEGLERNELGLVRAVSIHHPDFRTADGVVEWRLQPRVLGRFETDQAKHRQNEGGRKHRRPARARRGGLERRIERRAGDQQDAGEGKQPARRKDLLDAVGVDADALAPADFDDGPDHKQNGPDWQAEVARREGGTPVMPGTPCPDDQQQAQPDERQHAQVVGDVVDRDDGVGDRAVGVDRRDQQQAERDPRRQEQRQPGERGWRPLASLFSVRCVHRDRVTRRGHLAAQHRTGRVTRCYRPRPAAGCGAGVPGGVDDV